ncbi:Glutaminyl-peptide cyclotransferase [Dillenia turbinata]|uniref:Glutaminyl-peptide cyclotransferase n=1 Tax=Dillenia turbinata TaxID=194707 RepID=A0AAN8V990_9MAGN
MKSKTLLRKKTNKRSNHSPSPPASMASPKFSSFKLKRACLLISFLVLCVMLVSGISRNKREKTSFRIPSSEICLIEVMNQFPHDPRAFTQGLLYAGNDTLFESTGLNGKSSVRKVALQTGKVLAIKKMEYSYFGEGLTLLGDRLFQVTWLRQTGFIYDRNNLSKVKQFSHQMQDGWGLATDGEVLFGSDGTSTLYQIDPQTFKVLRKQTVRYKDQEVHNLNELEFVNGEVWANIWQSDCIARISHESGNVVGWILLPDLREGLLKAGVTGIDVLNGIAWDNQKDRVFVTGKLWPVLYEIKLQPLTKPFGRDIEQLCMRGPVNFMMP